MRTAIAVGVVAVLAALFAIAFRVLLRLFTQDVLGAHDIVAAMTALPMWARVALPAGGGLCAGGIAMAIARRRVSGGGVGYVMEAIVLGKVRVPLVRSALQAAASWVAIAGGNSLGREGPLIAAGAAFGEGARRVLKLDDARARIVLAAGVAAGFASAYNAPIAACLFVVEIVTGVIALELIVPIVCASVIATLVVRLSVGDMPLYGMRAFAFRPVEVFAFAGLGIVAAPAGVGFLRVLAVADPLWAKVPLPLRSAVGGALCGAVMCAVPAVAGNGFEPLSMLLDGKLVASAVGILIVAKVLGTAASVGSGNPGGVFTPTLLIGGLVGTLFAFGLAACGVDVAPGAYALVGFAAALAATTHAPITAAVLACELSGDYALVVPLLLACAIAAGLARRLYIDSVYTAELSRRGLRWRLTLDGRRVVENQQQAVDVP